MLDTDLNTMRLFVAIDMPEHIVDYIRSIQNKLAQLDLFHGSFTKNNQCHITLKFIGNVASDQVENIDNNLRSIRFKKQLAYLHSLSVFERDSCIRIILFEIACPGLALLAQEIDQKLILWGDPEKRNFVSHLTLARVKKVDDRQQLLDFISSYKVEPIEFIVDSFVLKKSELRSDGATYTDLYRYALN